MIRICGVCSNISAERLRKEFPNQHVEVGCIGQCGQHQGFSFGYINSDFVLKDNEEDFIQEVIKSV